MSRALSLRRSAPLILLVAGCHDRIAGPRSPLDRAASMTATSVVDQTGMVAAMVPSLPAVVVRDASGNPVAGVPVWFDGPASRSAFTGSDGIATIPWTLPRKPGSYTMVAHAGKLGPVRFSALAVVGPPAYIKATPATDLALLPGVVLAESVSVFVADYVDNPLAGVAVDFEIGGLPGATIEHVSAVTNESGIASPGTWTLGNVVGVYTLTARVAGIALAPTASARVYEPFKATTVAAGGEVTCANALSGVTYCWGVGYKLPTRIQGDIRFVSLTVGFQFACGLTAEGAAFCWGHDVTDSTSYAAPIVGLPHRVGPDLLFSRISAGLALVCGLSLDGRAYCWGQNQYGQLGNGTTAASADPKPVAGGHTFVDISAGSFHACGVTTSGETYCWGINNLQQLGVSSPETCDIAYYDYYNYTPTVTHMPCSPVPLRVSTVPALATISASEGPCGLTIDGTAFCWGRSSGVQQMSSTLRFANIAATQKLVVQEPPTQPTPTAPQWLIDAAMCGTTTSGAVFCGNAKALMAVAPNLSFSTIVAGLTHQCGITRDSALLYCWGVNTVGALGNGTWTATSLPRPVLAP